MSMSGVICMTVAVVCLLTVKNEPSDVGLSSIEPGTKKGKGKKGGKIAVYNLVHRSSSCFLIYG